jgi:MoaA/NifB/PqqE/SkfB family radical SAM enzyme
MSEGTIRIYKNLKIFESNEYNYTFNMKNGKFFRWGMDKKTSPVYSQYGAELLDVEVSTICSKACAHCYKGNNSCGHNMSFDTFKQIFDIIPTTVTQVAFGVGDIDANPDLWKMMEYCRSKHVIPNITINGERMTDEIYQKLVDLTGAVSVSLYDTESCYNTIAKLTKFGHEQVNIHVILSEETFERVMDLLSDARTDPRLSKLHAIVFLQLKPKGERNELTPLISLAKYRELVNYVLEHKIRFGFDSCSSGNFLKAINSERFNGFIDACESSMFSYYVNVDGVGFPCSFAEDNIEGIDLLRVNDFLSEVWFGQQCTKFRDQLIASQEKYGCKECPIYDIQCHNNLTTPMEANAIVRNGFVANSSTSIFICDVCGSQGGGSDSVSMDEYGYSKCINGHTICTDHVQEMDLEKKKEFLRNYKPKYSYDTERKNELMKVIDTDDFEEEFDEWMREEYEISDSQCPICSMSNVRSEDLLLYALHKIGMDKTELQKEFKEHFVTYKKFKEFGKENE